MATILIVDDLSANRRFLIDILHDQGHRLLEAADGAQGLEVVQAEHPDLVITDVLMPVMDGYEFVRRLRLDPATSQVPVLFYTAPYGEREANMLASSHGVPYVLTKPPDPKLVLQIIGHVLSGAQGAGELPPPSAEGDLEDLWLLSDALPEKSGDLRSANARMRALINITLDLSSGRAFEPDLNDRLGRLCTNARDLFGATYVTLGLLHRSDLTLRHLATSGTDATDWIKPGSPAPGILGKVVAERRAMRGSNPGGDPAGLQLPSLHPEVQEFLVLPLASSIRVQGWICLVGNEGRTFTEDDQALLTALSGQVGRIYQLQQEILDRKQAESALRVSEERTRFALEAADIGIWDMDHTTGALHWSDILEAQYGLNPETFAGTYEAFADRLHPDDRESVLETIGKAMKAGGHFAVQHRVVWPDGTVRWLAGGGRVQLGEHGEPVRGVGVSRDVTEVHHLEEQHRQALKMEALGRLAGGVSHDFNNLLTAILGYCELALVGLDPDDPRRADLAEIQKAGTIAAGLTRQLLAFSRKQVIEPTVLDLNLVAADLLEMLGRLLGDDVTIALSLQPEPAHVLADRGQVEQVLMNLAVNARDAMPTGGTLTIGTAHVHIDETQVDPQLALRPGPHVVLTVTDTGTGMTAETRAHLFEPFFTTKDVGKGTGLGLASVHGIVARNGGSIAVDSELGRGTSFKVYWPEADASGLVVAEKPSKPLPRAEAQTVLVVEDADNLRKLTRRLLERQGYTVLVAANADEAIALFEQNPSIDVLLSDVVMPGASGPELVSMLIERRPGLRVVYMSGYAEDTIVQNGVLRQGFAFLHKPFTSEEIGGKIREALER